MSERNMNLSEAEKDQVTKIFEGLGSEILPPIDDPDDLDTAVAALQDAMSMEEVTFQRPGNTMSYAEKVAALKAFEELERRKDFQGHFRYYPDEGPLSRHNYPKHIEFLNLGALYRERMFMAANQVGKSTTGGFEMSCHLTGLYPHWWEGRRFGMPTDCWTAGDSGQTTRDINQLALLGKVGDWGTGMIPRDCIIVESIRMRPGVPGGVDTVNIRHSSGGISTLGFKSYDQKRKGFNGVKKHVIWLDEEPPLEVYGECLIRTMNTQGILMVTFTPLMGITPFVDSFLQAARDRNDLGY